MKRPPSTPRPGISKPPATALVLIGAGGHAMVVAEAADLAGFRVLGACDDAADAAACRVLRVRYLGPIAPKGSKGSSSHAGPYILALGDLKLRRRILSGPTLRAGTAARVIHPQAIVHASARIGGGAYVGPGAIVHTFADIGAHAIINSGAIVEHECSIGENAHVAPGAVLGGRVRVGEDSLVGLGARVLPNIAIGRGCTVGAGAVVIRDVPDKTTVTGIPARRS